MAQQGQDESKGCLGWFVFFLIVGGVLWFGYAKQGWFQPKPSTPSPPPTRTRPLVQKPSPTPTSVPVIECLPEGRECKCKSSGSSLEFEQKTCFVPSLSEGECVDHCGSMSECPCIKALSGDDLDEHLENCLLPTPWQKTDVIAAVLIGPPGHEFNGRASLTYKIPPKYQGVWRPGDELPVWVWDKSEEGCEGCPGGDATVVDETSAKGDIEHSSIYVLLKPISGEVPAEAPVSESSCLGVPVRSLFGDLDSMMRSREYAALGVYFIPDRAEEVVEAIRDGSLFCDIGQRYLRFR